MKIVFLMLSFWLLASSAPLRALDKKTFILPCTLMSIYGISYALFTLFNPVKTQQPLVTYKPAQSNASSVCNYYLFAHGLAETHKHALSYAKGFTDLPFIIDGFLFTYDYPDATSYFWQVNWMYTTLGQGSEIECLKNSYKQAIRYLKKKKISEKLILFGISRGAPTVLNFVGCHNPTCIKALLLEAPFDSTASLSNNILSYVWLDKIRFFQKIGHYVLSAVFWQHSVKGEQAKDCVLGIPKELPILLVCSKQDKVVPWHSTYNLYKILRQNGYPNVHIFIAEEGGHLRIREGADGEKYQQITQAFYKKYGCAYNEHLAQEGEVLFKETQPPV